MNDAPTEPEPTPGAPSTRMELPTWNRTRTKRVDASTGGDDAFQGAVRQAGRKAAGRGRMVLLGILGAAAIATGVVVYQAQRSTKTAEVTLALASGVAGEARGRIGDAQAIFGGPVEHPPFPVYADEASRDAAVTKAMADLEAAAPGTSPALAAKLVDGAAQLREGDFAAAEASYRAFLQGTGERHPLRFMAREGLAFAREGAGDVDGAVAELRALAGEKGALYREMALYHQGRLLAGAGRKDEALAALKIYAEEYPLQEPSLARDQVRGLLETLDPSLLAGTERAPSLELIDGPEGGAP